MASARALEYAGGVKLNFGAGVLLVACAACAVENRTQPRRDVGPGVADSGADAGIADAVADADAQTADAQTADAQNADALADDAGSNDASQPAQDAGCSFGELGNPDRDRVLLVGHPFGAMTGQDGTELRSLSIGPTGTPIDDGMRLDVGVRPARIAFVPDGSFALVLGEDGTLVSVSVGGPRALAIADMTSLPPASFGDLTITAAGTTVFVTGSNVAETSGVSTVHIGCSGTLTVDTAAFFNMRLAESLVLLPGETRAILLGGQAVFPPVDPDDVRLLERAPAGGAGTSGFVQIDSFDIYMDFIDAGRIAVSPNGQTLLIPNGSPASNEGGQVAVVSIAGDVLMEVDRLIGFEDAREALWSADGGTALITLLEPGRVKVLADLGAGLAEVDEITGIGIADQMAQISRGRHAGLVYVSSVDAAGPPNVAVLRIEAPGIVSDEGQVSLGNGSINIPGAIAVMP